MFKKHSIAGRVVVGKVTGLIIGVLALLMLPLIQAETSLEFKLGFLLLMALMGVMIGFIGVFKEHPVFSNFTLRWWMRGPMVGFWFFLVLALLAQENLESIMASDAVSWMGLTSPYWVLLDGAFLGGLIGYIATKVSGEGEMPSK